jgi:hypothetical protein
MALHATIDYRWTAFGLVGVSLAASLVHELTSEHVRHELELARPTVLEAQRREAIARRGDSQRPSTGDSRTVGAPKTSPRRVTASPRRGPE